MESKPKREDLSGRALSLQLCCAAAVLCCAVRCVHAAGRWACTAVCCCTTGMPLCSGVLCGVCCTSLLCAVLHLAVLCVLCSNEQLLCVGFFHHAWLKMWMCACNCHRTVVYNAMLRVCCLPVCAAVLCELLVRRAWREALLCAALPYCAVRCSAVHWNRKK